MGDENSLGFQWQSEAPIWSVFRHPGKGETALVLQDEVASYANPPHEPILKYEEDFGLV